ncbi:dynamin-binding protein [Caerostris extrusa]|uniref:Dynamin-binding protein n=1 Tax=Caerostris extrusa TaxID=172846 RepID=A0AAV4TXP8_CAEEX|nr:dynamin-binding protein [Caerostris extrusa]
MSQKAKVKMNMKAQIDEEMDLFQDEIVTIIEEVEKDGTEENAMEEKEYFQPLFVTILSEDSIPTISQPSLNNEMNAAAIASIQSDNHTGYDCINSGIMPYGRTIYPFKAEYANELSFKGGEIVNLIRYVDDNWLEGEIDGDVTLKEGDTVTLIRKIDSNWYEVVTDNGETGICPESYIEIIGSGPPSYNEVMGAVNDFPVNNSSITTDSDFSKMKSFDSSFNDSACSNLLNLNSFSSQKEKSTNSNFSFSNSHNVISHSSESFDVSFLDSSFDSVNNYDNHSNQACLNDSGIINDWKGSELISTSSRTPARPPPPTNTQYSRNNSILNSSDSSLNSNRLSVISASSQSSTEASCERVNIEEIKSLLLQKEQTVKIRMACKNKLENERGQCNGKGINVPLLFGNLDEVIDVARRLLRRLQKVSRDTELIGECFVDLSDEMKEAYGHYCRNHDEVNSVIDKIDQQSAAGQYLHHKVEIIKRQTNCFDLPAMLIKPVQRILKYPLLLNELLKVTEDSHPDKQWLIQATNLMTDVAIFKYRKEADTSLSGRISKLTIHSMAKKTSRFGMRISSSIGLKTVNFARLKIKNSKKLKQDLQLWKNLLKYFRKIFLIMLKTEELITTAFNISEDISEFYQERKNQQEVEKFRDTHRIILTEHWDTFKQTIERSISSTIKLLLQSFRGPTNLIQKRYDKLLDFESASSKMEKNKDVTKIKMLQDNLTMAKNTYEALNSQLLDDLPKLCDLSIEILYDCIRQGSSILDTFQVKHTLVMDDLSQLTILPKELQSCIKTDTLKRNSVTRSSGISLSGSLVTKTQSVFSSSKQEWNSLRTSVSRPQNSQIQDVYAISQKQKIQPKSPQRSSIQPSRPAPTVTPSLRVVAPSRYPPAAQYEEINESFADDLMKINSSVSQDTSKKSDNVIAEFDPYSATQSSQKRYDNVLDNFNELYSTHRYEDIPDETNYDQVPIESQSQSEIEVS